MQTVSFSMQRIMRRFVACSLYFVIDKYCDDCVLNSCFNTQSSQHININKIRQVGPFSFSHVSPRTSSALQMNLVAKLIVTKRCLLRTPELNIFSSRKQDTGQDQWTYKERHGYLPESSTHCILRKRKQ